MTIADLKTASTDQPNARAEDGLQRASWNSFCEGILIPLGSLFAILLVMVGMMLINS